MWPWLAGAAVVIVGLTVALIVVLTRDDEHIVDEGTWRQAREAQGTTFTNWDQYADTWVNQVCTDPDFDIFLAMRIDSGVTVDQLRTDFTFACPGRLGDFEKFVISLADPCAGMDAETRALFEEASGTPC
jgi:hypothetical protein